MIFGVPAEIQNHENRVGATPELVQFLKTLEHQVFVETNAGLASGFDDDDYVEAGATIVPSPEKLYAQADFLLKVQAPMPVEYDLIRPEHTVFAYYHLLGNLDMARALMGKGCSCYAYDQVKRSDGSRPFNDLAGRIEGQLAVQQAGVLLQSNNEGKGVLLASLAGASPAEIAIIGETAAAQSAAIYASNLGCHVSILVADEERVEAVRSLLPDTIDIFARNEESFAQVLPSADVVISAANESGPAEIVVDNACETLLSSGTVILDLDIASGGSVESSTPTTHENPTFLIDKVIHYCVPNLAGVVASTGSVALSTTLLGHFRLFPERDFEIALKEDDIFFSGLATFEGRVAEARLASELSITYFDLRIADE